MLAIRLPEGIEARLDALARKTGRTKTHYVREAVLEHLQDLEGFYLAEQRMKRYSEKKTIPLERGPAAPWHGVILLTPGPDQQAPARELSRRLQERSRTSAP